MPSAFKYIPATDKSRSRYSILVSYEYQKREAAYQRALKYYKGEHESQLAVDEDDEVDDNVVINLVKMAADRTASFLFPRPVEFITNQDAVEKTEHEIFLDEFLEASGGLKTLVKWSLRGFLAGHTYIQVFDSKPIPRFAVLDPLSCTVFWRADDQADVIWYETRFIVGGERHIRDFVKNEDGQSWTIYDYRQKSRNVPQIQENQPTLHGRVDAVDIMTDAVEYELIKTTLFTHPDGPLLDTPHLPDPDSYYGMSEADNLSLQNAINRLASIRNQIARELSQPVDFLAGADIDDLSDEGGILSHASPDAKVTRLELKGDLAGITSSIDKLVETYLALVRVVLLKGEAKDLQRVTNASVRTLFLDAIAKNGILQSAYGSTLVKAAKIALLMGYKSGQISETPVNLKVKVDWPNSLPEDMTETANMIALALAGKYMSQRTAAETMGLDYSREKIAIQEEFDENLANQEKQLTMEQKHATIGNENKVNATLASNE